MTGLTCDIAIVGGGLAGGLAALALARHRPDISVRLIEAGPVAGGNHRWSWFASDLEPQEAALLDGVPVNRWDNGYLVCFPAHLRQLATPYRSLASADLAATLARDLAPGTLLVGQTAQALDVEGVVLADGTRISARTVVDARGFAPTPYLKGGWQVFMGAHLRLAAPHGLYQPVIMDAEVAQLGGYRFVYVLPLGPDEVFVEDTYYQDTPALDEAVLAARIAEYARAQGWQAEVLAEETGVLPVITGGDFAALQAAHATPGVAVIGARGGFVHPLTSYTLPFAVRTALAMAAHADLPGPELAALLAGQARAHWRATRFYRSLGRMLFSAAQADQRYRIFQRFYRLPEPLIERFYAGQSTVADMARVLVGRPPVPILAAMGALISGPPPLYRKDHA